MKKLKLLLCVAFLTSASSAWGQNLFWTFDDNQTPITIPAECEARFDEIHGGVFMPTVEELLNNGKKLLTEDALTVQQQGAYCILGAAVQGNAEAQYILAQLYEKGKVLPQDDLSAYKWAFISALNGQKEAESLTLLLEQFLSTDELEKTTSAIEETRQKINENLQKQIDEEKEKLDIAKGQMPAKGKTKNGENLDKKMHEIMPDMSNIFTEDDRMK